MEVNVKVGLAVLQRIVQLLLQVSDEEAEARVEGLHALDVCEAEGLVSGCHAQECCYVLQPETRQGQRSLSGGRHTRGIQIGSGCGLLLIEE